MSKMQGNDDHVAKGGSEHWPALRAPRPYPPRHDPRFPSSGSPPRISKPGVVGGGRRPALIVSLPPRHRFSGSGPSVSVIAAGVVAGRVRVGGSFGQSPTDRASLGGAL